MGRIIDRIVFGVIIIIVVLGILTFAYMMTQYDLKSQDCAEQYGGKVVRGYCTYIRDGNSQSFSIWDQEYAKERLSEPGGKKE